MNLLAALPVAAGAALAGALLVLGGEEAAVRPAAVAPVAATVAPAAELVAPARRNVTPAGVTPGPAVDGPLVRIAVPEPPPPPARWQRHFGAVAVAAGTLEIDGRPVRLAGIEPPAPDMRCGADAWPCGRAALTAFRMFLRGRAVECLLERGADSGPCRIGGTDLAAWLVEQGWAGPAAAAGPELVAAATAARCAGRGLWRGLAPGSGCPR